MTGNHAFPLHDPAPRISSFDPTDGGTRRVMKIILANPRGFCAGVNMAIECLERALDFFGSTVYVYHEIVHNKYVVDRFKGRGTIFVESLDEVPEGSPLLYSAHGVSPQIREQARSRRLLAIDATCPLVTKVHLEAIKYAREGYTIILIGHEGHDEVIGTMGEAPEQMVLVETAEDVQRLSVKDPRKVAYLTQTTLSVDDANIVIAAFVRSFPISPTPPRTTSATPRRTARRLFVSWRHESIWFWCWVARTAPTVAGWRRSQHRWEFPRTWSMASPIFRKAGSSR